ncbi:hypothetical protein ACH414_33210 [Streptomyces sp. NPDC020422]
MAYVIEGARPDDFAQLWGAQARVTPQQVGRDGHHQQADGDQEQ